MAARSSCGRSRPSRIFRPAKPPSSRSAIASAASALRRLQPQPVAVVGLHRADRAAEQHAQRQVRRSGQRIPRRHVEARDRDHRLALIADEMQRFARDVVELERRDAAALQQLAEIVQRRHQVAHRLDGVGLEIGAADDALFGEEVDQDQRPFGNGRDLGDHRALQLQHDGARADRFEGERGQLHDKRLRYAGRSAPMDAVLQSVAEV